MQDWVEGAEIVKGNSAGSFMPFSSWCLVLHTTEGYSVDDAISTYRKNNTWPHFTFNPKTNRLVQHVPLSQAARALKNLAGGVETNRYRSIQIEIVGMAGESQDWPVLVNKNIGLLIAKLATYVPFKVRMPLKFLGEGDGFLASEKAKQRMTFYEWYRFDSICGHQHVPENQHWDPGNINEEQILKYAIGDVVVPETPEQQEEREIMGAKEDIVEAIDSLRPRAFRVKPGSGPREEDDRVYVCSAAGKFWVDRVTLNTLYWFNMVMRDAEQNPPEIQWDQIKLLPIISS